MVIGQLIGVLLVVVPGLLLIEKLITAVSSDQHQTNTKPTAALLSTETDRNEGSSVEPAPDEVTTDSWVELDEYR